MVVAMQRMEEKQMVKEMNEVDEVKENSDDGVNRELVGDE